jgi:preprotein translocase subunit SecA
VRSEEHYPDTRSLEQRAQCIGSNQQGGGQGLLFKKKNIQREDDRVWATTELKWNGIVDEILNESGHYLLVLAVAHFKKTATDMRMHFQARNLQIKDFEGTFNFHMGELKKESNQALIVMAERISEFNGRMKQFAAPEMKDQEVLIIVAEHHPLHECDEALLSFISDLPFRSRIRFHSALDEPLLKMFGAERVLDAVKHLGWDEREYISHPLISSAIEKAQKRIKDKATGNQRVDSMDEWFHYNLTMEKGIG